MFWLNGLLMVAICVFWSTWSAIVANFARLKGRTWASFYLLALVGSPLLLGTIVATVTEAPHSSESHPCENCSEAVRFSARTCPSCGSFGSVRPEVPGEILNVFKQNDKRIRWASFILMPVGAILVLVLGFMSTEDLMKNLNWASLAWATLGVGLALLALRAPRTRLSTDMSLKLEGVK
jgi:hypothetical protein